MVSMPRGAPVTLFVCGDVMTGRGVDQILAHPNPPGIQESCVRDAREYVELAQQMNGPIAYPVDAAYIWGDATDELDRMQPDARVINLETSVTRHDTYWPGKGIHYRMHPENVGCLTASRVDVCALANNHVLDYGYAGLEETLRTLRGAGIGVAGAGLTLEEAQRPAIVDLSGDHRVIVFSVGATSSGIPLAWAAGSDVRQPRWGASTNVKAAGLDMLPDLSDAAADKLLERVQRVKRARDIVVVSIHWGDNWGYEIPASHVRFAHRLLEGAVDLIHGHSSHHPRAIEVFRDKLVLYGCGDFISDYEGISGFEEFRDDLVLMYFPVIDSATGGILALSMVPLRMRRLQLVRASPAETGSARDRMMLASSGFGAMFELTDDGALKLERPAQQAP